MNNKPQQAAITQIHKLTDKHNFCAFILCDEDLLLQEDELNVKFTDEEKTEIYEHFHEKLLDVYYEILTDICNDIIENR